MRFSGRRRAANPKAGSALVILAKSGTLPARRGDSDGGRLPNDGAC